MTKRICADHVTDPFLVNLISQSTEKSQCSYCERTRPTIAILDLASLFSNMLAAIYECTTDPDSGWMDTRGASLNDLISKLLAPPEDVDGVLIEDMEDALDLIWTGAVPGEQRYPDIPFFEERTNFVENLGTIWNDMERSLQQEARFFNSVASQVLTQVFGQVHDDKAQDGRSVIITIGPGTEISQLYRARAYQSLRALEDDLSNPEMNFGPPPPSRCNPGRMNAKGIAVFYGSIDKSVTLAEVRPPVGSHVVVASFKILKPLRLLDLHRLEQVKVDGSPFDPDHIAQLERRDFLETLCRKMVMPVMPETEDTSYMTTQAVAEYLANHPTLQLDGILFRSAQDAEDESANLKSRNVVLFHKVARVLDVANPEMQDTYAALYDYFNLEPGHIVGGLNPTLQSLKPGPGPRRSSSPHHPLFDASYSRSNVGPNAFLQLDRDNISIIKINGIHFATVEFPVRHIADLSEPTPQITGEIHI